MGISMINFSIIYRTAALGSRWLRRGNNILNDGNGLIVPENLTIDRFAEGRPKIPWRREIDEDGEGFHGEVDSVTGEKIMLWWIGEGDEVSVLVGDWWTNVWGETGPGELIHALLVGEYTYVTRSRWVRLWDDSTLGLRFFAGGKWETWWSW